MQESNEVDVVHFTTNSQLCGEHRWCYHPDKKVLEKWEKRFQGYSVMARDITEQDARAFAAMFA